MVDATVFISAARAFADLVDRLPSGVWDSPGLGGWDVRALTGHTSRALITVSTYLQRPSTTEDVVSPEAYYWLTGTSLTADSSAVAERGRQAGVALGDNPARTVRVLLADVLRDVDRRDDPLIETIVGGMRMSAYLPTRTFELAVHSLDIAAATGTSFSLPEDVLAEAVTLAGRMAVGRGDGAAVLMALTGRRELPGEYSVV